MAKFRKKPVEIEARQYLGDCTRYKLLQWINEGQYAKGRELVAWTNDVLMIPTLEGPHRAEPGDWIICGVAGEFYPCKPEIFEATYEAVENSIKLDDSERQPCEVWTRVMGYFRPVSSFNVGKKTEHRERVCFMVSKEENEKL